MYQCCKHAYLLCHREQHNGDAHVPLPDDSGETGLALAADILGWLSCLNSMYALLSAHPSSAIERYFYWL